LQRNKDYNEKGEKIHEKYTDEPNSNVARLHKDRKGNPNKQDVTLGADGKPLQNYKGFNDRWRKKKENEPDNKFRLVNRIKDARDEGGDHDHCLDDPKGKNPGDVFFINPRPFPEAHFATFPVNLPLKILKCACPKDGTVLDPFFGAGTVGVAAEQLALNWIGIELKQEYIDIARKRLLSYQNERLN